MANEFIIKNGFHSKGNSQVTGSLTATSFSGDGSALTNLPAASANNFGIAQGSGSFTYYSSLSESMAAATSGDTVQMFSNYIERTSSVSLKDGVTLDGNGFTYTFSGSGTQNALEETSAATSTIYLNNLIVKRIGGAAASLTENLALYVGASNQQKIIYNQNVLMENDAGCAVRTTGGGSGATKVYDITARGTTYGIYHTYGSIYHSKGYATTGTGIYGSANNGAVYQSYGESEDGVGIYAGYIIQNCVGVSGDSYGLQVSISSTYGTVMDCIGISTGTGAGDHGIYNQNTSAILQDCEGYGNAGAGIYSNQPSEIVNCTGNSKSGYGIYLRQSSAKAINCHAHSVSSYAGYSHDGGKFLDCSFYAQAQHGILIANSSTDIIGCSIEVEDASKNCIYAASSYDIDLAGNVYKGATTAVNANLTNVCTNVPDEQGNIHVTSSVDNSRIYSGSFSGSFQGDGSNLTGVSAFPFSGDAKITGSLDVSGSITTFDINMSTWTLGADAGNNYYYFTGPGDLAGTEQNPDIHLTRGQKYRFYNPMDAHPFQIQDLGGSAFSTGVTNNGVQLGFLSFDVPMDGPTHLKYQCTSHGAMVGNIYIADARVASGSFSGSFQGDGSSLTGISGGTNLTQSLFVSPSGNDGTATVGDITKPFATILAATSSANVGDTIIVYPGTHSANTNIIKDGVNYYFHPGAHVTGSAPFINATLTSPVNIRGYGKFETSYNGVQMSLSAPEGYFEFDRIIGKGVLSGGSNKHILDLVQTGNDTQVLTTMGTVTNVDSASPSSAAVSFNGGNLIFKGNAINSGSEGYGVKISDDSTDVIIEGYIYSANGTAYYDVARNINTIVRGRIETGDESNFNAIYIHDGYSQGAHFDADIRGSIDIDTGEVSSCGVIIEGFQFCDNSPSSVGAIKVSGGYNIFNQKIIAKENIFVIENGHNIFNGQVNIINNSSGKMFDIQGGTLVFNGIGGDINHRVTSNTISGGTLIINNYLEHYGSSSPTDADMFDLSGGTLEINNKIKYFQDTDDSGIVNMTGGYLKLNGAQLIHNDPSSANHCILLNNSSHSGSILNNSFTNIPVVFQSGSFTNEITGGGTLFYSDKLY